MEERSKVRLSSETVTPNLWSSSIPHRCAYGQPLIAMCLKWGAFSSLHLKYPSSMRSLGKSICYGDWAELRAEPLNSPDAMALL